MRRALALSLAALALALALLALFELVRGPLHALPARHLQALFLVIAAAAAGALLARPGPASAGRRAALAALLSALAMLANTRLIGSGDTRPAAYLPFALVRTHSLSFERLLDANPCLREPDGSLPYWFVAAGARTVSKYPLLTGLLALPFELPSALGRFDLCADDFNDLEKLAAVGLACLGIALLFLAFEALVGQRAAALAIGLYVAATPVLPLLGQALWQHTGACLGLSLAAFGLFDRPQGPRRTARIAFGAGLAVACRPPDVFIAVGFALALLAEERRYAAAWLAGTAPLALAALGNLVTLGAPFATGYGSVALTGWTAAWPEGFAGLLVSPARGLLVLSPVLGFAAFALARPALAPVRARQARLLALGAVAQLALMAKWAWWTGGYAPSTRMLAEALPVLGLGLALATKAAIESRARRPWFGAAAALSLWCTCLVTYVPPSPAVRASVWAMSDGPWSLRAYPPLAYLPWGGR